MELILTLRLFDIENPSDAEEEGYIGEYEYAEGTWSIPRPPAEGNSEALKRYYDDHLTALGSEPPAPQTVYDGTAVVLQTWDVDVLEDGVEYRYEVHPLDHQAISTDQVDDETGLDASRTVMDERIAAGMQRSADHLGNALPYVDVISPRSLGPVAEAASDLVGGDEEDDDE